MRLFCFGAGYSARAVLRYLGADLEKAWGTTRSGDQAARIEECGAEALIWSGSAAREATNTVGDEAVRNALTSASHVLVSVAPGEQGDPVLDVFESDLETCRPGALCYLSTVGVYGDHGGAWVDEETVCRPVSKRSQLRLEAEQAWTAFGRRTGVPVSVIRLAGIYGPGRGPFEKLKAGTSRRIVKPGQVFNRIHVDDIARIVGAALRQRAAGIFNGADDEPAPPQDVIAFASGLIGMDLPPEVAFADADLTPMARSFYGENKRVGNDKVKRDLGVALKYPTYREGLRAIVSAGQA